MSGIEKERIINKEMLDLFGEFINCVVCKMIVRDPYTCEDCETSCCKICFKGEFTCNKCKSKNIKFFPSVFKNFLNSLQVKCKNCQFVEAYNKIDEHQNFCFEKVSHNESSCKVEDSKKDSFFKSFVEVSQEISKSYDKVDAISESTVRKGASEVNKEMELVRSDQEKAENERVSQMKLLNDLNSEYVHKDINDVHSVFSDQNEDKFSKISSYFIESLQNKGENEAEIINLSNLVKNQNEDDKDFIIRGLITRVSNLEKLCSTIIGETSSLKNTFRCVASSPSTNIFTHHPKISNIPANQNLLSQKGMIIFNNCSLCNKITNIKIQLKCDNCTKDVCPDCYYNCKSCNTVTCKSCGGCSLCKELNYCYKCKYSCNQCIKNKNAFGKECIRSCEVCQGQDSFCKRCCSFKCSACAKFSCLRCIWTCKSCYCSFCINHTSENCKSCGTKSCVSCFKKCLDCGENMCSSCLNDCSKCGNSVCKRCSVNYGKENKKSCKLCLK